MQAQYAEGQFVAPQNLQQAVTSGLTVLDQQQTALRIWQYDATLWKSDPAIQEQIKQRLGWLTVVNTMQEKLGEITSLVAQVRQDGYKTAVLLGMGGSSLCPEVLRLTFGVAPGYLNLFVLDTTDPATIYAVEQQIDLETTLFIVASKSGDTIETLSHFKYFFAQASEQTGEKAGEHFIAITDPETPLVQLAQRHNFRHTFLNPPTVGGRYSALSLFGLVPGALIGIDIAQLLSHSARVIQRCQEASAAQDNPGLWLGAVLGTLGKNGRDKVTFIISPALASFGYWVEQMIAESTGKEGHGLLPVEGEPPGPPAVYGNDRLFVYLRLEGDDNATTDSCIDALQEADQPIIRIELSDRYELGAEFFRWELATIVAGMFLDINPLDEPDVEESKDNTKQILAQYQQTRHLPELAPVIVYGATETYGQLSDAQRSGHVSTTAPHVLIFGKDNGTQTLTDYLQTFFTQVKAGDYIALMAYVQRTERTEHALQTLRTYLRDRYKVATTIGYGPRFLHSTGQLHKGGANNGIFIQITEDIHQDLAIPGEPYTFGTLKKAQSLGDLYSLDSHQRRLIRVHIFEDTENIESIGGITEGLQIVEHAM